VAVADAAGMWLIAALKGRRTGWQPEG